jgi:hypothetical protein
MHKINALRVQKLNNFFKNIQFCNSDISVKCLRLRTIRIKLNNKYESNNCLRPELKVCVYRNPSKHVILQSIS